MADATREKLAARRHGRKSRCSVPSQTQPATRADKAERRSSGRSQRGRRNAGSKLPPVRRRARGRSQAGGYSPKKRKRTADRTSRPAAPHETALRANPKETVRPAHHANARKCERLGNAAGRLAG